jgi:DNA-binding transcriptional MerR regulator/methylmalonyl-CoA mutase cobalamin-binding subunit
MTNNDFEGIALRDEFSAADRVEGPVTPMSIAAVERDTGLSKDTLRVWERRYGFPSPSRDANGERVYLPAEVDKLRILHRLIGAGHRPGKIIGLDAAQLQALVERLPEASALPPIAEATIAGLERYVLLLRAHQVDELRKALAQAVLRQGLESFVVDVCAPLTRLVGEAWAKGALEIFEEHLYTESMQVVLRNAISNIPLNANRPRVLLTTVPTEQHGLGLLMAEAVLALEGCRCISLGTQTPVTEIALAAIAQQVDIVALSFSAIQNPRAVLDGLAELRLKLPSRTEIWVGGGAPVLHRRSPPGVTVIGDLAQIRDTVVRWNRNQGLA